MLGEPDPEKCHENRALLKTAGHDLRKRKGWRNFNQALDDATRDFRQNKRHFDKNDDPDYEIIDIQAARLEGIAPIAYFKTGKCREPVMQDARWQNAYRLQMRTIYEVHHSWYDTSRFGGTVLDYDVDEGTKVVGRFETREAAESAIQQLREKYPNYEKSDGESSSSRYEIKEIEGGVGTVRSDCASN